MQAIKQIFKNIETCLSYSLSKRAKLFKKLCGERVIDLLLHMPSYVIEKIYTEQLSKEMVDQIITTKVRIDCVEQPNARSRKPIIVFGKCGEAVVEILLFNYKMSQNYIKSAFPIDSCIFVSGKLGLSYANIFQFVNPEKLASKSIAMQHSGSFNIYPLTAGIFQNTIYAAMKEGLRRLDDDDIDEWLPEDILFKNGFPKFKDAIKSIHNPKISQNSELETAERRRLCFDEMLAEQINIRLMQPKGQPSVIIKNNKSLISKLMNFLDFELTESQDKALHEIFTDMESSKGMMRLLQGDVGSGKTIVAILAALYAIESGYQCALLVPTEILARQHYHIIAEYFTRLGILVEMLTANETGKLKATILERVESGSAKVLIGTHAIITDRVKFHNLGLVVIDEQHRFGVGQRLQLIGKGTAPHILSMTATPIPRTMVMAMYGDIAVSSITEKPKGRTEIITTAIRINKIQEVIEAIKKIISQNQKIYWVCPLIEENSNADYTCVINRFHYLKEYFSDDVQMLYGKMKSAEKQKIFANFKEGRAHILVSTTVIEVGVDVPDATVIIIENAEKFGLAQLHQLRGRVGRSHLQSYCILMFDPKLSQIASERIRVIKSSGDGFYIAEKDLLLRGGGEILGTKQSGQKKYKTFDAYSSENQPVIYEVLKQTSRLASEIVDQGLVEHYKNLLAIHVQENPINIKKSF
ncbi:MAG: ATP-dependent DNA helicase RecG [Holosporales bacterium]|jgi:ATP-dependent DNA helicase RecG|nr:ATP-dependent DNA helicase RecG [Holosporales bacterium]